MVVPNPGNQPVPKREILHLDGVHRGREQRGGGGDYAMKECMGRWGSSR